MLTMLSNTQQDKKASLGSALLTLASEASLPPEASQSLPSISIRIQLVSGTLYSKEYCNFYDNWNELQK